MAATKLHTSTLQEWVAVVGWFDVELLWVDDVMWVVHKEGMQELIEVAGCQMSAGQGPVWVWQCG